MACMRGDYGPVTKAVEGGRFWERKGADDVPREASSGLFIFARDGERVNA